MRLKALANHNRVVRLEDWNGLDLTGTNDCSSIVAAAMTQGAADGAPVLVPSTTETGGIRLVTGIEYKAPLIGSALGNQRHARSTFLPAMSDGSAVFWTTNREGFHVENICVKGSGTTDPMVGKTNCVAFKFGDASWVPADGAVDNVDASRGYMVNTLAYGVNKGYSMLGWVPRFDNIHAEYCSFGFEGRFLNSGNVDLVVEGCGIGFELSDCDVLYMPRILDESNADNRTGTSRIDRSFDLTIASYYTEGTADSYPWLTIGGREPDSYAATVIPIVMKGTVPSSEYLAGLTGLTAGDTYWSRATQIMHQWSGSAWVVLGYGGCRNIQILSGMVGSVTGSAPIVVDYSSRHSINVLSHDSGSTGPAYQETANARADMSPVQRANVGPPGTTTATGGLNKVAYYLNPNPGMGGKRFGCDTSATIRATVTQEATISRSGSPGVRVTADAGAGGNNLYRLYFRDAWVARIAARGTGFTVGAWVWIPDTAGMGSGDSGTIYYPALTASTIDGSANADTQVATTYRRRGAWNFLHLYQVPQTDATELRVSLVANLTTNEAPGDSSVYIVVDEMYIAEGDCWEHIAEGRVIRSAECSGHVEGGKITLHVTTARAAAMIADTTQTFQIGDQFIYTDSAAGGVNGKKLTSAGWRDSGVIALT